MTESVSDRRRRTPRTDAVLDDPRLAEARRAAGPRLGSSATWSRRWRAAEPASSSRPEVCDAVLAALPETAASLRPVVNATGVVVHTNLGRAPLSAAAIEALRLAAGRDRRRARPASGRRGRRGAGALRALRDAVPGAEACTWSTTAPRRSALATGRARGRAARWCRPRRDGRDRRRLPDPGPGRVLRRHGCARSAPPTGCARADYAAAIGPETGFVLKVHPSNFRVQGFTAVRRRSPSWPGSPVPVVVDIGSGLLAAAPAPARRARRRLDAARRRRPGDRLRRQAARRPAVRAAARRGRRWSSGCAATRWPARCGSTSSPWPRSRPPCTGPPPPVAAGPAPPTPTT